ncbi:tRNA (adenosine(37)-N6)-threonylcarbamoyltransferase complex dimerization subunit type 1 TsaB [soil metagenome]
MKLLAIETSTEACSVALWIDGQVRERHEIAPRRHTDLVLPSCDALLAEAGIGKHSLDAIAVGRGPGAFTGVRLAVALVQGMALALDRPVLAISTLAALAFPALALAEQDGSGKARVLAAIDARMGELYLGLFSADATQGPQPLGAEWMARPELATLPESGVGPLIGVGSGFAAAQRMLATRLADRLVRVDAGALPHAADVARLAVAAWARGEAIAADRLEPAYLRDKVALTIEEQLASKRDNGPR